jgi:hypothetical protein
MGLNHVEKFNIGGVQARGFTEQAGLEQLTAQEAPVAAGLATAGGEYAAAGAYYGSEGAMQAAEGSLLSSASGGMFRLQFEPLRPVHATVGGGRERIQPTDLEADAVAARSAWCRWRQLHQV